MKPQVVLQPRFVGRRFDAHTLPLSALADLLALQALVEAVAQAQFRQLHPDRQRLPPGFTDSIGLHLCAVAPGSAVAQLAVMVGPTLFPADSQALRVVEAAVRAIQGAVLAADGGGDISAHVEAPLLRHFDRFGRGLQEGEAIELGAGPGGEVVRYTQATRRALVLAEPGRTELSVERRVHGRVPDVSQLKGEFTLLLDDGTRVSAPLGEASRDAALGSASLWPAAGHVELRGVAVEGPGGRLARFVEVMSLAPIDHRAVRARLQELGALPPGWLDGAGAALDADGLRWLGDWLEVQIARGLPAPSLYPTAEGGVRAEWTLGRWEASLEVDLRARSGAWHAADLSSDADDALELPLQDDAAVQDWVDRVAELGGGEPA